MREQEKSALCTGIWVAADTCRQTTEGALSPSHPLPEAACAVFAAGRRGRGIAAHTGQGDPARTAGDPVGVCSLGGTAAGRRVLLSCIPVGGGGGGRGGDTLQC